MTREIWIKLQAKCISNENIFNCDNHLNFLSLSVSVFFLLLFTIIIIFVNLFLHAIREF